MKGSVTPVRESILCSCVFMTSYKMLLSLGFISLFCVLVPVCIVFIFVLCDFSVAGTTTKTKPNFRAVADAKYLAECVVTIRALFLLFSNLVTSDSSFVSHANLLPIKVPGDGIYNPITGELNRGQTELPTLSTPGKARGDICTLNSRVHMPAGIGIV